MTGARSPVDQSPGRHGRQPHAPAIARAAHAAPRCSPPRRREIKQRRRRGRLLPLQSAKRGWKQAASGALLRAGRQRNRYCNRTASLTHDHCIHSADFGGKRVASVEIVEDALLVRNGYAETGEVKGLDDACEITQVAYAKGNIKSILAARAESSVVHQR